MPHDSDRIGRMLVLAIALFGGCVLGAYVIKAAGPVGALVVGILLAAAVLVGELINK